MPRLPWSDDRMGEALSAYGKTCFGKIEGISESEIVSLLGAAYDVITAASDGAIPSPYSCNLRYGEMFPQPPIPILFIPVKAEKFSAERRLWEEANIAEYARCYEEEERSEKNHTITITFGLEKMLCFFVLVKEGKKEKIRTAHALLARKGLDRPLDIFKWFICNHEKAEKSLPKGYRKKLTRIQAILWNVFYIDELFYVINIRHRAMEQLLKKKKGETVPQPGRLILPRE